MPSKLDYRTDQNADNRLNPYELRRAEADRAKLADIAKNFDKTADASRENANIEQARDLEQDGFKTNLDSIKNKASSKVADKALQAAGPWGTVLAKLKGKVPTGVLVGIAILIGAVTMFTPMGMPLLSFGQNATEARANASRSQNAVFAKKMEYTVNNDKVTAACAKNVSSNACKRGTISERQKKLYEDGKFKVDAEKVGNRYLIKSFTTPDGIKLDTGKKFTNYLSTDFQFTRLVSRVHNVRALVFNGGRMLKKVLIPLGLSKKPITENAPKDAEGRKKFLSKLFGMGDQGTIDAEKTKEKIKIKADELSKGFKSGSKAVGAAAIVGATCTMYNGARLARDTAKAQRLISAMQRLMPFFQAYSQIRDGGTIQPDAVSLLAGQITTRDKDGLSALDAPEVKELFGAKNTGWSKSLQSYLLFNNPILKSADDIIETIDNAIRSTPGLDGAKSARAICREVNSWKTAAVQLAICGIGTAAGSAVPIAGTAVGFVTTCVGQALAGFAAGFAGSVIANQLFEQVVLPWVVDTALSGLPGVDAVGPELGTVLGIGAATLMNTVNRSNGLVPLKKKSLTAYNEATSETDKLYRQIQIADARDTPFDIYNQYSFVGSIASALNNQVVPLESRMNSGTLAFQRLFSSWSLIPSALAIGESQSVITADNLQPCNDNWLRSVGYDCDSSDQPIHGNSARALTMTEQENVDYYIDKGYTDKETGDLVPGTEAEKYHIYCTDNNPPGIAALSIEDEDYDWATKEKCGEDIDSEKMSQFQRYELSEASVEDSEMSEAEGASGGLGIDVMSYNILGTRASIIHDNSGGIPWRQRLNNAVSAVKQASPDIIGFQEVTGAGSPSQFDLLKRGLSDTYTGFPTKETNYSSRVIYWKSDKFTLVDSGTYSYPRNGTTGVFPWVKLRENSTSKEFYIFNTHTSAGSGGTYSPGGPPPKARRDQTRKMVEAIKKEVPPGMPVLATGDFNATCEKTGNDDGVSLAEIPCTIMRDAGFENAGEAAYQQGTAVNAQYATSHGEPNSFNISKSGKGRHIDHVFYTGEFGLRGWENVINKDTERASDHTPVIARVSLAVPETPDAGSGECPAGTTAVNGITEGYERSGQKKTITLCAIPGTRVIDSSATPHWRDARYKGTTAAGIKQIAVNADSAASLLKLAQDAKRDGITLTATIGYRSIYEQCSIVKRRDNLGPNDEKVKKNCPSWITPVGGNWKSKAVFSNHMMGYSVDFLRGSSFNWMKRNGPRCGWIDDVFRNENWDELHFTNKGSTPASCNLN